MLFPIMSMSSETILPSPSLPSSRGWRLLAQTARYLASGLACMAVEQAVVLLMKHAHSSDVVATATATVSSVGLNYLLNVGWVFRHRAVARRSLEMAMFAGIMAVGFAVNMTVSLGLSPAFQEWCGPLGLNLAKAIGSLTAGIWGFTSKKLWLFPDRAA